ncbi:hypothetical protein FACS189472_02170 [Alphaproteobacteria bacterium]|nr:hypothetical protein FACS189472_02170 [Alphaproteobacteria bacterium]
MHYEIQYAEKKIELKKAYYEFVKAYKKEQYGTEHIDVRLERLQTTEEQEKEFERFIESYADKQPCLGCRASWYHHYGHLIDMIDLRIKHLKIHISQNNVIEHQDYNLKTFDVSDDELVGHTFAELENKDYTKQYHEKKIDLKKAYDEFVKRSGMGDAAVDQQKEFERFIESYAKKNQCMYLRSAWYHYCGALVDMIDLRIKHLKIYTAWYSGDT